MAGSPAAGKLFGVVVIDPVIVEQFTGQRRISSFDEARSQPITTAERVKHARGAVRETWLRRRRIALQYLWVRGRLWIASLPATLHAEAWIILLMLASVASVAVGVFATVVLIAGLPLGIGPVAAAVLLP